MRKVIFSTGILAMLVVMVIVSCQKSVNKSGGTTSSVLTDEEKSLIKSAGFDELWAEKTASGSYLIEGDILLTAAQLKEMSNAAPTNNIIVAEEEHYRTFNLVSTPQSGTRTITVRLGSGFPSYYSTALDKALAHYNTLNLKISFQRVSSGGDIVIKSADLGTSGGGCILGQSAGFPSNNGNPASSFTLSTSSCATTYLNTEEKVDEVMAHELGHCIGFRHTDYKNRISCGGGGGEGAGSIGAVHIDGTPTNVRGNYDSWMMACTNGKANFNADDQTALQYVY
jgi:hypothetical protein